MPDTAADHGVWTDVDTIAELSHHEAMRLFARELRRSLDLMRTFDDDAWIRPTECPDWDVRELYLHVLGAIESGASRRELAHQGRTAWSLRRRTGVALEAALSATQVAERSHLSPEELVRRFALAAPRCVRARNNLPAALRTGARFPVDAPVTEWWSLGYLVDVIYLRDAWLHRIDASRATGIPVFLTPDHDARIVADVVREWARRHRQPFRLLLTGPAGGRYVAGDAGKDVTAQLDAVEFCRTLSGRIDGTGLMATVVPF